MPVTRRAFLGGAVVFLGAACESHPHRPPLDPDAAVVAAARDTEHALIAGYDALLAGPGGDAGAAARRADHAAHLAALGPTAAGASPRPTPSPLVSPPPPTPDGLRSAERASAAAMRTAAVDARGAHTAAVLAALAASHLDHVAPAAPAGTTTPPPAGPDRPVEHVVADAQQRHVLQAALATEHQVVYGYGLVGAHLAGRPRRLALSALDAHAARRDALVTLLTRQGAHPVPADPAYRPPYPVVDRASALRLAVRLEDAAAGVAWDLVATTGRGSDGRRLAVDALGDAAVRETQWRSLAGMPPTPPLPGQPG